MIRDDVAYLVSEDPQAHGIFAERQEAKTMVYCRIKSVTRTEFWKAYSNGIEPALVLEMSDFVDYGGQKIVEYNGKRYRVVRTYVDGTTIELTLAEVTVDA